MSGFVPPNARKLIAAHVAQKDPHPIYLSKWESGQYYPAGTVKHSPTDYRAYRSKVNFSGDSLPGDPLFGYVTLLTDVDGSTVVDKSLSAAEITAAPDVVFGNIALGHQLIHILGSQRVSSEGGESVYDLSIPASQAQFGLGDFCIQIILENCVFTDTFKDLIDFGCFKVELRSSEIRLTAPGGYYSYTFGLASLDLNDNNRKHIVISRSTGLMAVGAAVGELNFIAWNFPANLSATQPILVGGPSGITADIAIRITTGKPRSENNFNNVFTLEESWATVLALGPSVIDPAFDPDNWELVYSPPDVTQAVADALPAAVAQAVADALPAAVAQAVAAANVINSGGQGGA